MAENDASSYHIRFNEISQAIEYATGNSWIATPTNTGGVITGSVSFSGTSTTFTPPKLTTTQRDALTATSGMLIYNTTTNKLNVRAAAAWEVVTSV